MAKDNPASVRAQEKISENLTFVVDNKGDGLRLDKFLATSVPHISRTRIKSLIEQGFVTLDGKTETLPRKKIHTGQRVLIKIPAPKPFEIKPKKMDLSILYEDEHLLAIDKPPGLVVHPGAGTGEETLVHGLMALVSDLSGIGGVARPGIVHRLDKDTSGVILIAKHDSCHHELTQMFKRRDIKKIYWAIVRGGFSEKRGIIDLPIGRHQSIRTKMAVRKDGRPAKTSFTVLENLKNFQLLALRLHTGRTHQIRVHLSHEHAPILGDSTYGGPGVIEFGTKRHEIKRQMLHAKKIEFVHPITKKALEISSPVPEDFSRTLEFLRRQAVSH